MGGALWLDELDSTAFVRATYAIFLLLNVLMVVIVYVQLTSLMRRKGRSRPEAKKRTRYGRTNILTYFAYHAVGLPIGVTVVFMDPDKSKTQCNIMFLVGGIIYMTSIYFTLRLLLAKAFLYDAFKHLRRLICVARYLLHLVYLPILLITIIFNVSIRNRQFATINGRRRCVEESSGNSFIVIMVTYIVIAGLALIVISSPLRDVNSSNSVKTTARRTLCLTVLAVTSTVLIFSYIITSPRPGEGETRYLVIAVLARVLSWDVSITFITMSLTWPLRLYIQGIKDLVFPQSEEKSKRSAEMEKKRASRHSRVSRISRSHTPSYNRQIALRLSRARSLQVEWAGSVIGGNTSTNHKQVSTTGISTVGISTVGISNGGISNAGTSNTGISNAGVVTIGVGLGAGRAQRGRVLSFGSAEALATKHPAWEKKCGLQTSLSSQLYSSTSIGTALGRLQGPFTTRKNPILRESSLERRGAKRSTSLERLPRKPHSRVLRLSIPTINFARQVENAAQIGPTDRKSETQLGPTDRKSEVDDQRAGTLRMSPVREVSTPEGLQADKNYGPLLLSPSRRSMAASDSKLIGMSMTPRNKPSKRSKHNVTSKSKLVNSSSGTMAKILD